MGSGGSHKTQYRPATLIMTATPTLPCRLCRHPLDIADAVPIGPFPQAAQYYPEPDEFAGDHGVVLQIAECPCCGLTQLLNEPVSYYRQVITAASLSPAVREQRMTQFKELRDGFHESPRALEIGCASGENLPLLRSAGYIAHGIEFAPPPVVAPPPEGVTNRYLLDLGPEEHGTYDLLISFNYLEHQPDARTFLQKCHSLLADNGKLLLTVPNLDFLLASQSAHEFVAHHLVYTDRPADHQQPVRHPDHCRKADFRRHRHQQDSARRTGYPLQRNIAQLYRSGQKNSRLGSRPPYTRPAFARRVPSDNLHYRFGQIQTLQIRADIAPQDTAARNPA